MLQLFAGMTPGGGVENTWERILELPTSVAIPGVLYHTFLFWLDIQVISWLIVMSKAHFFQAQNIAAQLLTAPALWLLNVVRYLCGSSMRDLETSFEKRINEERQTFLSQTYVQISTYELFLFLRELDSLLICVTSS